MCMLTLPADFFLAGTSSKQGTELIYILPLCTGGRQVDAFVLRISFV